MHVRTSSFTVESVTFQRIEYSHIPATSQENGSSRDGEKRLPKDHCAKESNVGSCAEYFIQGTETPDELSLTRNI